MGPRNGIGLIVSAAEAALSARHVVGVDEVGRQHGGHDVGLAAESVAERRAQRPVDEAARQRRLLGGTALTAEERAGDASNGVHPLLDVDGQREEVDALTQPPAGGCGGENLGAADGRHDGAVGQLGEFARRECDVFVADTAAYGGL